MEISEQIAVLDVGSRFADALCLRVRDLGVRAVVYRGSLAFYKMPDLRGVIIAGQPMPGAPSELVEDLRAKLQDRKLPILQIGSANDSRRAATISMMMGEKSERPDDVELQLESLDTESGAKVFREFIFATCRCVANWNPETIFRMFLESAKRDAGGSDVIVLLDGSVRSIVSLALYDRALGRDRVRALYVDHGFWRLDEAQSLLRELAMNGFEYVDAINASQLAERAVRGVVDREELRDRITSVVSDCKDQWMRQNRIHSSECVLAQESIGLYDREVRILGHQLRLSGALIERRPFPSIGLAARVMCSDGESILSYSKKRLWQDQLDHILQKYNLIFHSSMRGVVIPYRVDRVEAAEGINTYPVVLDGSLEWEQLLQLSADITSRLHAVSRVFVLCSGSFKDLLRASEHNAFLTQSRVNLLRLVDQQVDHAIRTADITGAMVEFPVFVLPFGTTLDTESIVLRPLRADPNGVAVPYELPPDVMVEIAKSIDSNPQIECCFYDITCGTGRW